MKINGYQKLNAEGCKGVTSQWTSVPSRRNRNAPIYFMPLISTGDKHQNQPDG